jgi:hypothetical protein
VGRDAASKARFLKNSNRNICKKALDSTRRIEAARHSSGSLAPELLSSTPTGAHKSGDRSTGHKLTIDHDSFAIRQSAVANSADVELRRSSPAV